MKKTKPKPKMRETDRLILNIALCTRCPDETLKEAMHNVRIRLRPSSLQNHKSELEILRDMWKQLSTGGAWKWMNEMIENGYMRPLTFKEFDERRAILKVFQYRARNLEKTKEEARKAGLL